MTALRHGFAGLAVGLFTAAFVPKNVALVASVTLFVGGLANVTPSDWKSIVKEWLRSWLTVSLEMLKKRGRDER